MEGARVRPSSSAPRERLGSFVLLAETEKGGLGTEYRAAQLGPTSFERLAGLIRFPPGFPADAVDTMLAEGRAAMKVGGPAILSVLGGSGEEGWLAHEYQAGRSLGTVLRQAIDEGLPFALDSALQVARQVGIALERGHARSEGGPLLHGCLVPWSVVITYEGAVRLRGYGLWASRAYEGRMGDEQGAALAPEQLEGHADARSDVYGLATLLLTCLGTGPAAGGDLLQQLAGLRQIDDEPLPAGLTRALERALAPRPAERQSTVAELRRELEAVLFSTDLATTTFNLAFFMQTLFRQTVDEEARAAARESQASHYQPEAAAEVVAAPQASPPASSADSSEVVAAPNAPATEAIIAEATAEPEHQPEPEQPPAPEVPPPHDSLTPRRAVHARRSQSSGPSRGIIIAAALVLVALAVGGFLLVKSRRAAARAAAAPVTLSPEGQAALLRVQELEARLKALEEERAQAEALAVQAEKERLEAEAKAKGRKVDPQALARAQEDAARRVRLEQEAQQKEERARLEQQKRDQQVQLAAAAPVTLPPAPTTTLAAAPPTTAPAAVRPPDVSAPPVTQPAPSPVAVAANVPPTVTPSAAPAAPADGIHDLGEPGLTPPSVVTQKPPEYPLIARTGRITGGVMVSAVVDEQGRVTQARAVSGNAVLRKPAVDQVNSRVYRAARKDGVPVKVRILVLVTFKG